VTTYRRRRDGRLWHWRRECPYWPIGAYVVRSALVDEPRCPRCARPGSTSVYGESRRRRRGCLAVFVQKALGRGYAQGLEERGAAIQ